MKIRFLPLIALGITNLCYGQWETIPSFPKDFIDLRTTNAMLSNLQSITPQYLEEAIQNGSLKINYEEVDRAIEDLYRGDKAIISENKTAMRPLAKQFLVDHTTNRFNFLGLNNISHAFILKDLEGTDKIIEYFAKQRPDIDLANLPIIIGRTQDQQGVEGGHTFSAKDVASYEWPVSWYNEQKQETFFPNKAGIQFSDANLLTRRLFEELFKHHTIVVISDKMLQRSANGFYLTLFHEIKHVFDYTANPQYWHGDYKTVLASQFDEKERNGTWYGYFKKGLENDPKFQIASRAAVSSGKFKTEDDFCRYQFQSNMDRSGLREHFRALFNFYEAPYETPVYIETFRFGFSVGLTKEQIIETHQSPKDFAPSDLYMLDFLNRAADEAAR